MTVRGCGARACAEMRVPELCEATGVWCPTIGTAGGDAVQVDNLFDVGLDELHVVHEAALTVAFEG